MLLSVLQRGDTCLNTSTMLAVLATLVSLLRLLHVDFIQTMYKEGEKLGNCAHTGLCDE
jgi:hypothetical protein